MPRSGKAISNKTGGRGKGRAPAKLQKPTTKRAKPLDSFEVYDASADASEKADRRHKNLEKVDVRDYEVDEIDSEDDEEIDSDAAFDESDEERFSNFQQFFKKDTKAQTVRFADEEEDEEEEEEEEDEGDLVDLSEMLDHDASDQEERPAAQPSDSEDLSGFGSSDSEDSDEQEDSEDEQARLSRLNGFVSSISARTPKKRFISEAGDQTENEHAVGSGMHARGVSLGLSDLLGTATDQPDAAGGEDQASRSVRLLREQVHKMEREARRAGSGVVAAPIARRLQDQMDRQVAYKQTKKSVSEWQPTVNEMRAAEHISFPLNESKQVQTTRTLISDASGEPATDMESRINSILAESGMSNEDLQRQYEELELKHQTPEEIRARQRELRMMRDLMFRSERRAKRTAKIKSKAYRRILKKEKERDRERALEHMKEEDPEMYAMIVEKMAQSRAEERMTLRHKNTGKWAKAMAKRGHDEDVQKALREQLQQHDNLKRKIYDIGSDQEDEGKSFDDIRHTAMKKLQKEFGDQAEDEIPEGTPHKALFEMKFMRNAMQRQREQQAADAQMLHDEFASLQADIDEDGNVVKVNQTAAVKAAQSIRANSESAAGAPGRMSFKGGVAKRSDSSMDVVDEAEENAKRVRLDDGGQVSQLSKDSKRGDKLSARLREKRMAASKTSDNSQIASGVLLDVNKTILTATKPEADGNGNDMDDMKHISNPNAFTQRELVEQAFAEDDVVEAEFAAEKEAEMDLDAPKDEDLTLPGWGSWGGTAIAPKKNVKVRKAVGGIEKSSRLDAKLGSVIINQRMQKASTKYYADKVPFPYFSKDHYDATMQVPLGKEWNTTKSHSRLVKPRYLTKAGRIIDPITIPSKKHQ
ncbi:small-subunit processome [Coemansia mojavensis]|nr:small-subunit processome [Coemansia mojavensis]